MTLKGGRLNFYLLSAVRNETFFRLWSEFPTSKAFFRKQDEIVMKQFFSLEIMRLSITIGKMLDIL